MAQIERKVWEMEGRTCSKGQKKKDQTLMVRALLCEPPGHPAIPIFDHNSDQSNMNSRLEKSVNIHTKEQWPTKGGH